jgi:hypothetical protein
VKDWVAWHAAYDDPSSPLSVRLRRVRSHLSDAIDRAPAAGPPGDRLFTFLAT